MKTKIIPFDLETAKKIQAREIEGKIKTRDGKNVRIICFDRESKCGYPIVALLIGEHSEDATYYDISGEYEFAMDGSTDLVLEVPDNEPQEPQFKPFDRVLVRNDINSIWQPSIFSYQLGDCCYTVSSYPYKKENIIPYEGNEWLVGTTNKPKEE